MNKTICDTKNFMEEFNSLFSKNKEFISKDIDFGFAVPSINISEVKKYSHFNKYIGAENVYFLDSGAVTGEISPSMAKCVGSNFVLVGHSERRKIFNETDEIVNKKIKAVLDKNMTALLCIGETLEQYNSGKTKDVLKESLLKSLEGINNFENIIIAYEPIWAIGTGKTATPELAQDICAYIRSLLKDKNIAIQYGGSVKPENIKEILSKNDIDGVLVGGASLDPLSMIKLLTLNV